MSLVITRFSIEELQRLNGLPMVDRPQEGPMSVDEAREVAGRGWLPMVVKRWPDPTMWDECLDLGCSIAFHYHDHRWYYRHGAEAICAMDDLGDSDVMDEAEKAEMWDWLCGVHGVEPS